MSGFRLRKPGKTIALIKDLALSIGITRVTDTTCLDFFGVPVYASIRPDAAAGSLCVNAGKGLKAIDAKAGAYMEAIEFYYAEYGNSDLKVKNLKPRSLDLNARPDYILGFCPVMNTEIDLQKKIGCVEAINIVNGKKSFVPAELVFFPCSDKISIHQYFGNGTTGLASGNNVSEATLHAIHELIERDIKSFHTIKDSSILLDYDSLPMEIKKVVKKVEQMGYFISIRYLPNQFDMPCFTATMGNENDLNPIYICGGYGCHLSKNIALNRAVTESFQSRLSFIHGGRDDLEVRSKHFEGWTKAKKKKYAERLIAKTMSNGSAKISFQNIPDKSTNLTSLEDALDRVKNLLKEKGFHKILRVVYTKKKNVVQVVRVIVPGLENFDESTPKIGNRLRDHATATFK
jgi:ribosomal protein S12 methylthiotransferase accessory factor